MELIGSALTVMAMELVGSNRIRSYRMNSLTNDLWGYTMRFINGAFLSAMKDLLKLVAPNLKSLIINDLRYRDFKNALGHQIKYH